MHQRTARAKEKGEQVVRGPPDITIDMMQTL